MNSRRGMTWLSRVRNIVALLLVPALTLVTTPASARPPGGAAATTGQASPTGATHGLDLNLSSAAQSIHVASDIFKTTGSATINVGGAATTITAGSNITPAELVALQQVLGKGTQKLVLDTAGTAVGGSFKLSTVSRTSLSSLVIPAGVVAIGRANSG